MQLAPFLEHAHTLARLCRHPQLPRERVQQFQNRKLRFLVRHAYGRVEYYRQLFDRAGIRPDAIRSAADLAALPISTKSDFRARPLDDLVARGVRADRLILRYTAGSTGEPTRVRRTEFEDYLLGMFRARTQRLLGRQLRDRLVSVTSRGVPTDRKPTSLMRLSERIGVWRYLQLDCLRPLDELARDVARVAPDVLAGYPGVLSELARLWPILAERTTDPRLIFIGGELATPAMRESIGRGFQAPVFNLYGSHEFNLLGWECPVTGDMHVCDDNVIIEVLQDGQPVRPNEPGDVVVTGLHGYSVPYIRYDLGDTATQGDATCRCGAPFSTLRHLRGRSMDYCVLPNGRKMHHWEVIPMTFWDMPWHRRYQFVQETKQRFALRVIADREPPQVDLETVSTEIRRTLGPGADFRIDLVDDLAFAPSGKHKLCRSEVRSDEPPSPPLPHEPGTLS